MKMGHYLKIKRKHTVKYALLFINIVGGRDVDHVLFTVTVSYSYKKY